MPSVISGSRGLILSVSKPSITQQSQIKEDTVEPSVSQLVSQWNAKGRSALQDLRSCPGVVSVEPSVVLDLLHPRSAGSSSLALPLRPDVWFTACASVHSQA